MRTDNNS